MQLASMSEYWSRLMSQSSAQCTFTSAHTDLAGETLRSYRFKLSEEQAIELSEDMSEELAKGKPLI